MLAYYLLLGLSILDLIFGVSITRLWSCYVFSAAASGGMEVFGSLNLTSND